MNTTTPTPRTPVEDMDGLLDDFDVQGHGLVGNAFVATALAVGGSVAMASAASADVVATDQDTCTASGGVWVVDASSRNGGYCVYPEIGEQASDPQDPYGTAYRAACSTLPVVTVPGYVLERIYVDSAVRPASTTTQYIRSTACATLHEIAPLTSFALDVKAVPPTDAAGAAAVK